jgi:tellurite resistance protein TerC
MDQYLSWIIFFGYVFFLLFLDFFVLHRKDQPTTPKKALYETAFFVCNAMIFSGIVYWLYNNQLVDNIENLSANEAVVTYLTGYLIELSLSVDNLFVIAIIFASYKIPSQYQHRLLFLGILGAIIFRATLISVGLVLVHKIHNITIFFGLFLLYTAFSMLKNEDEDKEAEFDDSKGLNKFFKISKIIDGDKFRTIVNGKKVFTALFGALLAVEFTDLLFALDSIPAIFAITSDPYLVFSSNIFAIMGLRSLYFFLADMLEKFKYLKYSVFAILLFVSFKLMTAQWVHLPEWLSLTFIAISLAIGVWVSIFRMNNPKTE